MSDRQNRYVAFEQFYKESITLFKKYADNPKSKRLDSLYSFYVKPGGRFVGYNKKIVEIFYGYRPFNIVKTLDNNFRIKTKAERASGATLSYQQADDGCVLCTISPAFSENFHYPENFILLDIIKDPSSLTIKSKWHWRFFQAYMESTCLDGNPSMIQKLYMVYLRCFKEYVIDGTLQKRKATKFFCDIMKYALTVGLSGFIILAVSWAKDSNNNNQIIERHRELLDAFSVMSDNIRSITDSARKINEITEKNQQEIRDNFNLINSTILDKTSRIECTITPTKENKEIK
ncbi:hypothetical protein LAD80_000734 [Proteus mirabilis]|uniref:hypothetical protein n=1 Tax=Proteus mirabilis TaxID=584 RepID=UPI001B366DEE|nr:hypothetical protein [Proteus mirabilis]EKV1609730.1 hypothetical protein [Proteus mirabilis]MBQ0616530.1 hypothetical protein [Proteus mirabilis]MCJ2218569.1 hypothetical protein [Proteus mirabilis]HCU2505159.1 hypothetical protein [Proteus mirabilis]